VTIFRRKRLPTDLRAPLLAFREVLAEVEPAKDALASVMPTTRLPGRSLPDALVEFEERLAKAGDAMAGWRRPETESVWIECRDGLAAALEGASRLRAQAPDLGGFEGLIWAVESLLDPLEPFHDAAARFRSRRVPAG
jgi:hypothetical protein